MCTIIVTTLSFLSFGMPTTPVSVCHLRGRGKGQQYPGVQGPFTEGGDSDPFASAGRPPFVGAGTWGMVVIKNFGLVLQSFASIKRLGGTPPRGTRLRQAFHGLCCAFRVGFPERTRRKKGELGNPGGKHSTSRGIERPGSDPALVRRPVVPHVWLTN